MAVLFFDGFDDYTTKSSTTSGIQTGGWTVAGNTHGTTPAGLAQRQPDTTVNNRCLLYNNPTTSFCQDAVDLGSNYTSLAGGSVHYVDATSNDWYNATTKGERILSWQDSANVYQCELVLDWLGRFHFVRGSTILASSSSDENALVRQDTIFGIEWEITFSQTVGTFKLWLNNVLIIDASGLDNCDTANANCRYVRLSISNGLDTQLYVDDFYITDGTRLGGTTRGNPVCISLHPDTDGGVNVWTALSGTDEFAMVDDLTSDGDTTYNQASTVGDESRHGCEALPAWATNVVAIGAYALLRKTDATAREARVLLNSGGTESLGATLTLDSTGFRGSRIVALETDPNTAAAWTVANVNALEVGYEVVT